MAPNKKVCIICNVIASVFSWVAFSFSISSVANNTWHGNNTINNGLWLECPRNGNPCSAIEDTAWIRAVRAFMILMIIFLFFGNLVNIVSQWKVNKKARRGSGGVWAIAATFGVVGASIYTGNVSLDDSGAEWDIGYIYAWTAAGLGYLANLFNGVSQYYMSDSCEPK